MKEGFLLFVDIEFNSPLFQPGPKTIVIPGFVDRGRNRIPVLCDSVSQIFAIGGCGVWDIVIIQPLLEFGLVPGVVHYPRKLE